LCQQYSPRFPKNSAPRRGFFFISMSIPFIKPATTVDEQIALLQKRGLIINDIASARHYLSHIGYYRLAGYWQIYQTDRTNHIFKAGTTIEEIIELYDFDRELRLLLLDAIERIEVSIRSVLSDIMCCKYGSTWYSEDDHFYDKGAFEGLKSEIEKELDRTNEEFIRHHDRKYGANIFPPAWKTLQILSFGTLSKLYGNIVSSVPEKKEIAKLYGLPSEDWLHSWIQVIAVLRNYCAHHCRVCYRIFSYPPKLMRRPQLGWIKNIPPAGGNQSQLLYFQICILKYLLHTCSPGNSFSKKVKALITKYPSVDIERMGFYKDWETEPLWV
jgi:abortive infection bacteriophage resistance protein